MFNDQVLQNAGTTGVGSEYDLKGFKGATFYITSNGTTSDGVIQLETSDISGYAGIWAPLASAINASVTSANKKSVTQVLGPLRFVRANISTPVTSGGTITVRVVAF